jgi:uncharacterized membrane protein
MYFYLGALASLEMAANSVEPFIMNYPKLGFKKGFYCFMAILICSLLIILVENNNLIALFFFVAVIKIAISLTGMVLLF